MTEQKAGPTESAYQRGRSAWQNGKKQEANPWWAARHPGHSKHELWAAWHEGWSDARNREHEMKDD